MKKYRIKAVVLAVCLSSVMLTGCKVAGKEIRIEAAQLKNHKNVFQINDYKCDIKIARLYFCNYRNLYGKTCGMEIWKKEGKDNGLESYAKDVAVQELSRIACMGLLAEEQNMKLSEEETEKAAQAAEEYYNSLNEEELDFMDVGERDIQEAYEAYALANKLYDTLTDGMDEEVSDDEARVIRVQQIVVKDKNRAAEISKKLEDGEKFSEVAETFGKASDRDTVVARGEYPEAVEEIAFNLDDGECSSMIEAEDSYYFICCLSKFEEELTENNKEVIRMSREEERFEDTYKSFVDAADFQMNDSLWSEVTLKDTKEIVTDSFFEVFDRYFKEG